MIYKIGYVKDVLGNNYLGIKFNETFVEPYIKEMYYDIEDNESFETFVANQKKRDGDSYHSTIINVMEMNKLFKEKGSEFVKRIDIIQSLDIEDIEFKGVGKVSKAGNTAYFIVLESATLDEVRSSLGLEPKDFHITIGFDRKDVFGVRKNQLLKKKV
jgi:hypothetical protein